ncbi:TPA: hypothetical protein DIC20_04425 [Candidatus Dependentiae bacterium]|nr:MAG: Pentapeptide repeat protein [candidate division TM6 bacterium GW2011_GWF2_36_131]KKQ03194.1 MAG: Pentapeptide repeat protein [candidate division TM6 bacterium GW2011_GWE2_36_25]KKQ18553.1 MAG: Pentapeptide repeat protein [candidate division TM6 bacterium GW2011_GWA2_36_9]HBR70376.1 hypothetical protein [Candidatus Dependentiae bacterium]HCU00921.1 hypothetical protein [Candidatus Dependentiae bacterium]
MNKIFIFVSILFTKSLLFTYNPDHLYQALSSKNCEYCDLSKLNMKEGIIKEFNLPFLKAVYGTNLTNSHFAFSNLNGSDLRGVNLGGSDLRYASLNGLYLSRANLENTDLRYTQSSGSDYCRTNVKNAHFENANFKGAIFLDVKNLHDAHCNDQTQLPAGYECINNKIKIVDCNSQKIIPIGYYCVQGNKTPQLLPIEGCPDELLENPDPREYYNYFENIKNKLIKNGNLK